MNYTEKAIEWFDRHERKFLEDPLRFLLIEIRKLEERTINKMAALDDKITQLQADVAAEGTVVDSAVTLIQGFPALIAAAIATAQAAGATPAQLQSFADLSTAIEAKTKVLADAVSTGTPAPAPAPAPTPTPTP